MTINKPNENTWNIFIRFLCLKEAIYCADNTAGWLIAKHPSLPLRPIVIEKEETRFRLATCKRAIRHSYNTMSLEECKYFSEQVKSPTRCSVSGFQI